MGGVLTMTARSNQDDLRPVPDPTSLTTDQLRREIETLREEFAKSIVAVKEVFAMRLDGMDMATKLLSENVHRVPTDVNTQVGHLRELMFAILAERDKSRIQADADAKAALATALSTK